MEKRYIDANKLAQRIKVSPVFRNLKSYWFESELLQSVVLELVKIAPTEDVAEVKHGKWTLHSDGSGTCNLCGKRQKDIWDFDNMQNYCGHCGAEMNGGIEYVKTI